MNSCCANHNSTSEWENPFTAIHEWNEKYADKEQQNGN